MKRIAIGDTFTVKCTTADKYNDDRTYILLREDEEVKGEYHIALIEPSAYQLNMDATIRNWFTSNPNTPYIIYATVEKLWFTVRGFEISSMVR